MSPRSRTGQEKERPAEDPAPQEEDAPELEQQDWEEIASGAILPESIREIGEIGPDHAGPAGDLPEEDDDNPYQESDDALPDDRDEAALARNPSKEGGRFDEI